MFLLLLVLSSSLVSSSPVTTIVSTVPPSVIHPSFNTDKIRQCSCQEANECKKSSLDDISSCYQQCDSVFEKWRNETDKDLLSCFDSNSMASIDAEECIFKNMGQFCINDSSTQMITPTDFTSHTGFHFKMDTPPDIVHDYPLLKRALDQFTVFLKFFHCTKNCVHKNMASCFESKGCGVLMPSMEVMQTVMDKCNKFNPKISYSLLSTCQCLAFRKRVKSLFGVCAVISNPVFNQNV